MRIKSNQKNISPTGRQCALKNEKSDGKEKMNRKRRDYGTGIPRHEIEALAALLLPEIQRFFESEEGQREFAEWQAARASKAKNQEF